MSIDNFIQKFNEESKNLRFSLFSWQSLFSCSPWIGLIEFLAEFNFWTKYMSGIGIDSSETVLIQDNPEPFTYKELLELITPSFFPNIVLFLTDDKLARDFSSEEEDVNLEHHLLIRSEDVV